MSTVNFNDTTPAALAGSLNVRWQSDASGNISANVPVGWTNYTPGVVGGGSMTVASSNVIYARWAQIGYILHVNVEWQGTFGGTAAPSMTISLPAPFSGPGTIPGTGHVVGPAAYWATAVTINSNTAAVNLVGQTFALATTYNVRISAMYQIG
jgi:hypothetical protein